MSTDSMLKPASELAVLIRSREISARELLDEAIARFELFNPAVNAITESRVELARERAVDADQATSRGESWGPFHGLPVTIKEAYDWVGTASTWGNPQWVDNFPDANSPAVERLLGAGAVIWAKTNVPFMLADWQSFNELYGCTNNPWDLDRTPGGSSGGSAVSLATGMAALEIGSDIGASIRNPAHYCGVFGHKPTMDLIPQLGHAAPGVETTVDIAVMGPLARSAEDLDTALSVLAGPVGLDAAGYKVDLPSPDKESLDDYRVGVLLDTPACKTATSLVDHLHGTVELLARAGVQVTETSPEIDQVEFFENYLLLLRAATGVSIHDEAYVAALSGHEAWERGERTYRNLVDHAAHMTHREWFALHQQRERYRLQWAKFFDEYDLLLCPAAASTAFTHDHQGERPDRTIDIDGQQEPVVDQLFWAGWSCSVYLPSTVAPVGLIEGLPLGVQIVAPHLHDRRSIHFASLIERELGGFVAPPGYETV
ncbi:MAG: amidase [Actinomycetota bacterium]|nr:amidase [Actinomycetota bacterium]